MDQSDKITVEVELDRKLVEQAANAGLDLGIVAETAIWRALAGRSEDREQIEERRRELREEIASYNDHVERHGLFSEEWRRF